VAVTHEERVSWLAFNLALAEWPGLARATLDRYKGPAEALAAPLPELRALGFDEDLAGRLRAPDLRERAQKEFDRLQKNDYSLLTFADVEYPLSLKDVFDPPYVLYCMGRTEALQGPAVAIVGTRRPSPYGRSAAERLAEDLASRGLTVVSGLARGIDAAAHEGALRGGRTVAVLGSGLRNIYPPENRRLAARIAEGGAVVTEFPPDAEPVGFHFPLRNRVISGLARGVVVVEAAVRSGALGTADMALEQGREVFAIPGPITSPTSAGTNRLIRQGAGLVEGARDILESFPDLAARLPAAVAEPAALSGLSDPERHLLRAIGSAPLPIDDIIRVSPGPAAATAALLTALELKGLVRQHPGKIFARS